MKLSIGQGIGLGIIALSFLLHVAFYDSLPDPVPYHWNARGRPDGFMAKRAHFFLETIQTPEIESVVRHTACRVLTLLFIISGTTFVTAAGWSMTIQHIIPIGFGGLLVVLGNYMGKIRRNFFIGIRTPWTLAHEDVWLRTHHFGGKVTVVAGLLVIATAIAGMPGRWLVPIVIADALISTVYSFVVFRQLDAAKDDTRSR